MYNQELQKELNKIKPKSRQKKKMASTDNDKFCLFHPNEKIQMYCSNCDKTVCFKCISGTHTGHQFSTIDDAVHKKRDQLKKTMTTKEDTITTFAAAISSVKTNHNDYSREIQTLTDRVMKKRDQWKKQIDEIADVVLVQMRTIADQDLEKLRKRGADLFKNITDLKGCLNLCREKLEFPDDVSIIQLAEDLKVMEQKSCPTLAVITPPQLVGDRVDAKYLRKDFGRMVRDEEEAASDFVESVNQGVKPHIDTRTVATINTPAEIDCATCVSTVGDDKAWAGYRYGNKVIALVNKGGQTLQTVYLGFTPGDVTTTNTGEILVTNNSQQVKKYTKDGQYESTIINTSPYTPRGLCVTSDNDILVCLYQSKTDNKVTRVTTTGKTKQTIQYETQNKLLFIKQHKPLFTDPMLVQENTNKDICVVDNSDVLVVVNKDGELRFRYPDKSTHGASISYCSGIVCDTSGNILLGDMKNHCIHLIDIDGNFVGYVLNEQHGINWPWGLSINGTGELWVCNNEGNEVKVIKYNS